MCLGLYRLSPTKKPLPVQHSCLHVREIRLLHPFLITLCVAAMLIFSSVFLYSCFPKSQLLYPTCFVSRHGAQF